MNKVLDFLALLFGIRTANNTEGYTRQRFRLRPGIYALLKSLFLLVATGTVVFFLFSLLTQPYFKKRNTEKKLTSLSMLLVKYQREHARLPMHLEEVVENKPLVRDLTLDSWGNSMGYKADPAKKAFLLFSAGQDQTFHTADDLVQEVQITSTI